MYDSDPNDLEGTDVLKDGIEQTILLHCWAKTDVCPSCGCESSLRIGVETGTEEFVTVPDCSLCDAVVKTIAEGMEFDLT